MGFDAGALKLDLGTASAWDKIKAESERGYKKFKAEGDRFAPNLREGANTPAHKFLIGNQLDAQKLQKQNLRKQEQAQRTALAEAGSARRAADVAKQKANQKSPNVAALLSAAAALGTSGASSTLLSGLGGGLGGNVTPLGGRR